jgi:hypothetical protein
VSHHFPVFWPAAGQRQCRLRRALQEGALHEGKPCQASQQSGITGNTVTSPTHQKQGLCLPEPMLLCA